MLVVFACSSPSTMAPEADAGGSAIDSGAEDEDAPPATVSCAAKTAQPLDSTWTVMVGSATRTARVHVPASYNPQAKTPIVINVHGRGGWGAQQASTSHAHQKSDAEGFVVIHPEGTGTPTSWNAGGGCCDPAAANNVDDSGFIGKLIDEASERLCVDPDRVFVMGLSNGGYLAHRVACDHSDRIAAIGAVAGLLSHQTCAPTRPMPVFMVHGTADTLVSYDWLDETTHYWVVMNGCTTMSESYRNGDASCVMHSGCDGRGEVEVCTIAGGGHQWPGGEALPLLGTKSDDVIATDRIWQFFVAHPR